MPITLYRLLNIYIDLGFQFNPMHHLRYDNCYNPSRDSSPYPDTSTPTDNGHGVYIGDQTTRVSFLQVVTFL